MKNNFKNMSDEELAAFLSQDDYNARLAFDEIYLRNSNKVYLYCKKIFKNDLVAQDVFQETFINFFEACRSGKSMTNVQRFLIKIARNISLNLKSKNKQEFSFIDEIELPFYDNEQDNEESDKILDMALQTLPDKYREVLILKEFLNMSYSEIALILDLNPSVVRIRIFRAKNKLREVLTPYIKVLKRI